MNIALDALRKKLGGGFVTELAEFQNGFFE